MFGQKVGTDPVGPGRRPKGTKPKIHDIRVLSENVDSKKDESTGPLKVGDSVFLQRPNAGCGIIIDIDELRNLYTAFFASARQLDSSTTCLICARGKGCWLNEWRRSTSSPKLS